MLVSYGLVIFFFRILLMMRSLYDVETKFAMLNKCISKKYDNYEEDVHRQFDYS